MTTPTRRLRPARIEIAGDHVLQRPCRGQTAGWEGLAIAASLAGTHPGHPSTADHEFVQIRSFPGSSHARLSPKRA